MTDDRSFERAARSWLETGPTQAPDRAVDAALLRIETTRQERDLRIPWRVRSMSFAMNRLALLGATAVIAIAVVGGLALLSTPHANVGTSSPPPGASIVPPSARASTAANASPVQLNQTFTSPRYGYSVAYPAPWAVTPAGREWLKGKRTLWGDPALDTLAGTDARFVGASQPLADGKSADDWYTDYCVINGGSTLDCGRATSHWQPIQIGGVTGYLDTDGEHSPPNGIAADGIVFDAAVVSGGRGYEFTLDGLVDRGTFERILATVTYPAIPTFDNAFTSPLLGYSVKYPSGLAVTPAARPWTTGYSATASMTDTFGGGIGYVASSTRIPAGMTFDEWYAGYDRSRYDTAPKFGTCQPRPLEETVVVDGVPGRLDVHCPTFYFEAVVFSGGRAYVFTAYYPISRPAFEAFLATIHLMPTSARN